MSCCMQNIKPSKVEWWLNNAKTMSEASHDSERKVGAILINSNSGAIIASGYNGFVRGAPDNKLPTTRPEKMEYMQHAEENLIFNCARHGISMDNCIVAITCSPCASCVRKLWQCGIKRVFCKELYRDFDDVRKMKDISLDIKGSVNGETGSKYFEIEYSRYGEANNISLPS